MSSEGRDLAILEPDDNEGYGNWPLPCQRDMEIESLVRLLVADRPGDLRPHQSVVLLSFAERMASLARKERSVDRLRSGIRAAALAGAVGDAREGLLVLPLLWRTASALGNDPDAEFRSAAAEVGSENLVQFARRDPEDQTIEAMGYVEVDDEFGFHYERTW